MGTLEKQKVRDAILKKVFSNKRSVVSNDAYELFDDEYYRYNGIHNEDDLDFYDYVDALYFRYFTISQRNTIFYNSQKQENQEMESLLDEIYENEK